MTIYINGFKASKLDLAMLQRDINRGMSVTVRRTQKGNLAITTA